MTKDSKYVTLSEQNFTSEVLESTKPVLVDFWAGWCGPCRAIAPMIDDLAADFEGRATVGKVDVDEEPGLAEHYGIRSIPTLLLFREGKVVDQMNDSASKRALADQLEGLLAGRSAAGGATTNQQRDGENQG